MPHALIVDDSKTARYALRQLLDKQQFTSDMVESAEQALEYLHDNTPDLIFMDHMMPGMDGFQAVKAIKSNRATAAIPIVMYTSTQGGVYFGQARALGAADVISKPASLDDLAAMLQRLEEHHLLGAGKAVPIQENSARTEKIAEAGRAIEREPEPSPLPSPVQRASAPQIVSLSKPEPAHPTSTWPYWLVASCILGVLAFAILYLNSVETRRQLANQRLLAFKAVEWAINQSEEFPYSEPPFAGERLQRLQALVEQLNGAGFRGTVRVESHVGEFCLMHMPAADGSSTAWVPAPAELRLTDCAALGQSNEQSRQLSAGQSAAFARFLNELPDGIRVELVPLGATEPVREYPTDPSVTAGEWNRVAQHNQRVHIVLQPAH